MWRWRETELNCVRTYILSIPELMVLEMGMSMRRYLPATGTAGFERRWVSGPLVYAAFGLGIGLFDPDLERETFRLLAELASCSGSSS